MDPLPPPLAFFLLLLSGWVNRHQQAVIDYLLEENRVLRAARGPRRRRLTDRSSPPNWLDGGDTRRGADRQPGREC